MRWIWLIAAAGCGSDTTDETGGPAQDVATVGVVTAAFVGYSYWTPEVVPGQDVDWCTDTYLVDTDDIVTCTQTVRLVSNGKVKWTHHVTHIDGDTDIVEVMPYGTWKEIGAYAKLVGGYKYQVDGEIWTVWPEQASNWDVPESDRVVLTGSRMMTLTPAP